MKMTRQTVLVVGASGTVGSEIVKLLTAQGHKVRATTSKKVSDQPGDGVEQVQVNLVTGEGISKAFEGVDRVFLPSPAGYADQYKMLSPLIQESKRRGLKKVVLMTAMGANAVETSPFRRAEIELEKSGLAYNIIRPNWFMQNFNTFWIQGIREHGKIQLPAGTAKVSFIDARDIAAVAAKLLTSDDLNNRDFDLTGPQPVDHSDVAKEISSSTGKKVVYENIEPATLKKGLVSAGLPEDYVDFLIMIFGFLRDGYSAAITDNVKRILGRAPIEFSQYTQDYKQAWA
jgi:uncharacterized protein YbjT (DUF2867 family)